MLHLLYGMVDIAITLIITIFMKFLPIQQLTSGRGCSNKLRKLQPYIHWGERIHLRPYESKAFFVGIL